MKIQFKPLLKFIALLLLPLHASAGWFGADFSADAIQTGPHNQTNAGKMYVGKGRVRTEVTKNGQSLVEIIDPVKNVALLLLPQKKVYMERPLPELGMTMGDKDEGNPCKSLQGATCRSLGQEQVNGRNSDKWEITIENRHALQWNDAQHKFPVKREIDGFTTMELRFVSNEKLDGRNTEKWQSNITAQDGQRIESYQWYDPELNIAIRQEMPGGYTRTLKNIIIGQQPDSLFAVPEGYHKETLPVMSEGN